MATVLVVDDNANNRLLLTTLLEHAGHASLEAATGTDGARMAAQHHPDAAIVDLSLPDMSGADLIRRLRSDSETSQIRIALYTATRAGAAIEEIAGAYGIAAVIPKPGEPREILTAIGRLLESPRESGH